MVCKRCGVGLNDVRYLSSVNGEIYCTECTYQVLESRFFETKNQKFTDEDPYGEEDWEDNS